MNTYEGMFLVDPVQASTQWNKVTEHIREILTKHEARILKLTKWSERKLAYPIKHQKRGTYVLVYFEAPPGGISPIKTECQLSETILRTLILAHEEKDLKKTLATGPALPEAESPPATPEKKQEKAKEKKE